MLPKDVPPSSKAYRWFARFRDDRTWETLNFEPAATALAARRTTADEITRIMELASELGLVPTVDTVEIDIAFHIAVLGASHNMFIAGFCPAMAVLLHAYFWAMWKLHPGGPKNPAREDFICGWVVRSRRGTPTTPSRASPRCFRSRVETSNRC